MEIVDAFVAAGFSQSSKKMPRNPGGSYQIIL